MENQSYYWVESISNAEIVELAMDKFSCLGLEEFSLEEKEVDAILGVESYCGGNLPDELGNRLEKSMLQSICKYYFSNKTQAEIFQKFLLNELEIQSKVFNGKEIDWVEEWKKHYQTVSLLGGKVTIKPEWEKESSSSDLEIFIRPGQGFGTGTHETTQLCLEIAYEENLLNEASVLDFGCGSGILGISCQLKKNAPSHVTYYDIDDAALENCKDNLIINKIHDKNTILKPEEKKLITQNSYDLIFANILAPVLIDESKFLLELEAPFLILSGILTEQVEGVLSFYEGSYKVVKRKEKKGWEALLLKRK